MSANLEHYKAARGKLPTEINRWHLSGAGLESLDEATIDLPKYGADELLVRHDACGICFSDIKIINLGPDHPRLLGRNLLEEPVVMGHEVSLTVVGVGDELTEKYEIGQRFIIQADVQYQGQNVSYGYRLDGGMAQYGIITKEVLEGDEGCYLVPIQAKTGYAEAALVEPWACVVAAYEYPNYRPGPRDGGRLLVVKASNSVDSPNIDSLYPQGRRPSQTLTVNAGTGTDYIQIREGETHGAGFDDILVIGLPSAEELGRIATALGHKGILNLVSASPIIGKVPIDVGRIHYEQQLYVSASGPSDILSAYSSNTRRDIKPGGRAWFVGAGGPMGQMHIQRAIMLQNPPSVITVTDTNDERLVRVRTRFGKLMDERNITLHLINPATGGDAAAHGPYDDIVSLVPSPVVIEEAIPHLAVHGVFNVFAGLGKGVTALLDLGSILQKNQRIIGTSGSSIADLKHTLNLVETDALSTNASLAAIGGLAAFREGLAAVKAGLFPGKTVIFPTVGDLPLMSIEQMKTQMPKVYEKLLDGNFWTKEAEEELFRERLPKD